MERFNSGNLDYEILADPPFGKVWVNGPDGGAVGRFNIRTGIDIHRTSQEQLAGMGQCLYCTHGKPTYRDWLFFIEKAYELWGVRIPRQTISFSE